LNASAVCDGELVVPWCDPPEVFETAEHAVGAVSAAKGISIERLRFLRVLFDRHSGLVRAMGKGATEAVTAIGADI
jgi:hypothetical protein